MLSVVRREVTGQMEYACMIFLAGGGEGGLVLGSWIGIFLSANKGHEKYNPRGFSPRCFNSQTTALVYSPQLVLLIQQALQHVLSRLCPAGWVKPEHMNEARTINSTYLTLILRTSRCSLCLGEVLDLWHTLMGQREESQSCYNLVGLFWE